MRLVLLSILVPLLCAGTGASLCPSSKFWSNRLARCVECSKCKRSQEVAVRPCLPHKDTVCGPISDLNIDWSWMPKEKSKSRHLERDRIHLIGEEEASFELKRKKSKEQGVEILFEEEEKKHKKHKKHFEFPSDVEERKQRKNSKFLKIGFPSHVWEAEGPHDKRKHIRFEDEKELERWLLASQEKLLHRKADLMKTLKEEKSSSEEEEEEEGVKLNHPIRRLDAALYRDLLDHESHKGGRAKALHSKDESEGLDLQAFRDLMEEKSEEAILDFKSVVPTHRLFLGEEPSTVSEIIGQVKDDRGAKREEKAPPQVKKIEEVVAVPFSTAETFVWDWQALLFSAAGVSCLLFVIAVIYTILNARQWRKVKIKYETDLDEMSSKLALMPSNLDSSAAEGNSTGRYLEQLLATQNLDERKENIYTNGKPSS